MTNAQNALVAFSITRLHCTKGIFKLSGHWHAKNASCKAISIQQLDMMASDGWEELNLQATNTQILVQALLPEVRQYLEGRQDT